MQRGIVIQLIWNGVAVGSIYAIVSLGFALIYNTTRTLHIAHGVVYTISGYLYFSAAKSYGLSVPIVVIISIAGAVCVGILTELIVYRPLFRRNAPAAILLVSSLGVYIILQNLTALVYGNQTRLINTEPVQTYKVGGAVLSIYQVSGVLILASLGLLTYLMLKRTSFGKTLKAISSNPALAEVIGIDIKRQRLYVFAIGSAFASVGAVLSAVDVGIDPNVGLSAVLIAIAAIIVGGVSNFGGAVLGGLLLGLLQTISAWLLSSMWQNASVFLILTAFLLFRPEGLLGIRRRLEERA